MVALRMLTQRISENPVNAKFREFTFRNCLENRDEWVDDLRSRAWKSAIRPIYPMTSGSVYGSISPLPTSEDGQELTTLARSLTPSSSTSSRAAALGGSCPRTFRPGKPFIGGSRDDGA